ncbi:hypothetical protein GXW77_21855 [Roseomonas alkaliterrae]|uniref:Uncharacterized SAM-binding protein YcdF (DUF218 family) n=1 Tax=Neoroseomonas alkaliterrae TaxID=1452450 RepID=A0A840XPP3_9PROT|nr:hypothetical protein [Neoroseomonas alkaliterrae]MBB5688800.1 uncharacterized SAM-binding protein YcdF (DUF218 family) [Neoroseomonas alkaliterrae]MBR0678820.1 hypothetical protein [Neoroseomonas alkaliterrae]
MLRRVLRLLVLLIGLGALAAASLALFREAPARTGATAAPPAIAAPQGAQSPLATPFGDALFRWRCTTGLRESLGENPDWPLRRVAAFCLCVADRLRQDGPRDIVISGGGTAEGLAAAEARLCRRP